MKTTIIALVVVIVMGVLAVNRDVLFKALEDASTYETEIEREIEIKEEENEVEVDVIDSANQELERINAELDAEETRLLEEQSHLTEIYNASNTEIEARLEKIRETRSGF